MYQEILKYPRKLDNNQANYTPSKITSTTTLTITETTVTTATRTITTTATTVTRTITTTMTQHQYPQQPGRPQQN
ncbi:hypothetical protein Glove_86g47 [Diversispora epigaea]|uniref:Uncharacterized protein n=1 Tax=Diversispora epigaea TaxID=1348612 RepID=A0A397J7F6_9GLOM|nr:hypothetical protein Glove_86g47 [Diversispora epigaea]